MTPVAVRVQKRRDALRKAGLRRVQIWVPDTRASGFEEECRRQARSVAEADRQKSELASFLDAIAADVEGWE
jgi:hypothetical protein